MPILRPTERAQAEAFSRIAYCNPFLSERIELEQAILREDFLDSRPLWSKRYDLESEDPNIERLAGRIEHLIHTWRRKLSSGKSPTAREAELYEDLVLFHLYHRYRSQLYETALLAEPQREVISFWPHFARDYEELLNEPSGGSDEASHAFACLFQVRRAFHYIFDNIFGASMPAARLRAAIWESIFTWDMRRYQRSLYPLMGDVTTLISGPSGTGKELVARAVAMSRYIPFDAKSQRFLVDARQTILPLNLSALSPTLIESELFGHCKGAFTGAVSDREGWLEACGPLSTVFLDEIGEIDHAIQVKLLRVLETRTFQRLGETKERRFQGKVIAATNRDLAIEMRAGRFRADLYYRLCSDIITTPSLREILRDAPRELRNLGLFIAKRVAGDGAEALASETQQWVDANLGPEYEWPGNFRELEQCVKNIMVRRNYTPAMAPRADQGEPFEEFLDAMRRCDWTAEAVMNAYCAMMYEKEGSFEAAGRKLAMDRRTVKARVEGHARQNQRT